MNAERKGKEREAGWKGRRGKGRSLGSTKRPICTSSRGERAKWVWESISIYRKADISYIHPTGIPFINLACFRTTQEKDSRSHSLISMASTARSKGLSVLK